MTLRPQALPPVPEATVAAVQAAFPKGNLYVELRAEFGILMRINSLLICIRPLGALWKSPPGV
jgi:hypothetical protein